MQSLKVQQQQQQQQTSKTNQTPVARITPRIITAKLSSNDLSKDQDEGWLSCEELETIEKRFNDLLQEPKQKKSILINKIQQCQDQRAKSCDRLAISDENSNLSLMCSKSKHIVLDNKFQHTIFQFLGNRL